MRMPTRELLALSLLTLVVALVVTSIHVIRLSTREVEQSRAQADALNHQVLAVLREAAGDGASFHDDPAVLALLNAGVAHTPKVLTVSITDSTGAVLLSNGGARGGDASTHPQLEDLLALNPAQRLLRLLGNGHMYEQRLEIVTGEPSRTFGHIVAGVDSTLIREQVLAALRASALGLLVSLPLAWLLAVLVAGATRRGVRRLSLRIDQLRHGTFDDATEPGLGIDFQELAGKLGLLAEEIRSERLRLMADSSALHTIMDHIRDAVLLLDHDAQVVFYNQAFEAVSGRPLKDARGESIDELLAADHPLARLARDLQVNGEGREDERCTLPTDDRFRDTLVSSYVIGDHDDSESTAGMLLLLEDLGSLHTLQALVDYSARLATMNRATADVVHDVKNPLHAMNMNLTLLERRISDAPPEVHGAIRAIKSQISSLDTTVRGFLDYQRPREVAADAPRLSLRSLLQDLSALMQEAASDQRVALHLEAPQPLDVRGDASELRRAILNVIQNAIEALPEGGRVDVTAHAEADRAIITIRDDGPGIEPEQLAQVFEYRYTTKPQGSGIGLCVVRRIVEAHRGDVHMSSTVGAGSEVRIRLPLFNRETAEAQSEREASR